MFSLIITIISIALVAALAVATIYYGGESFSQGTAKAKASTLVNQAQQIAGANSLQRATAGAYAASAAELVTNNYLSSVPQTAGVTMELVNATSNEVRATGASVITDEVCQKINEIAGRAATVEAEANIGTNQFGCYLVGTDNTFVFKG